MQHLLLMEPEAKAKYWAPISLWIAFLVFIFLMILMGKINPVTTARGRQRTMGISPWFSDGLLLAASGWVHFVELYPCKMSQQLYVVYMHGAAADNATFLRWPLLTTWYIQKFALNQ